MLRLRRSRDPGNGQNSQTQEHNNELLVLAFSSNDDVKTSGEIETQQQDKAGSSHLEPISGTKRPREGTLHSFFGRSISQSKAASVIQQFRFNTLTDFLSIGIQLFKRNSNR